MRRTLDLLKNTDKRKHKVTMDMLNASTNRKTYPRAQMGSQRDGQREREGGREGERERGREGERNQEAVAVPAPANKK